jgi:hypothetical protein
LVFRSIVIVGFVQSDDGSEELEEGEWRPEEGERDKYIFDDSDEEEAEEGEICDSEEPSSQWDQQQGLCCCPLPISVLL